jgi:hypothetical protein
LCAVGFLSHLCLLASIYAYLFAPMVQTIHKQALA